MVGRKKKGRDKDGSTNAQYIYIYTFMCSTLKSQMNRREERESNARWSVNSMLDLSLLSMRMYVLANNKMLENRIE